jgi:hypothetical protein
MAMESAPESRWSKASPGITLILIITGILVAVVFLVFLLADWRLLLPVWHRLLGHDVSPTAPEILGALLTILLYLSGCLLLFRRPAWLFVLWSVIGAIAIRLAMLSLAGEPLPLLFACTTGGCSGGWALGWRMSPEMLHQWPELMPGFLAKYPHQAVSAPGWPLLYQGLTRLLEPLPTVSDALSTVLRPLECASWDFNSRTDAQVASAWLGIASPLWSALAAVPLYLFGRGVADEKSARAALVWFPLILSPALFATSPSPTYALPATAVVALSWSGVASVSSWRSSLLFVLAGALMGATLIVSLSLALLLPFCGMLLLCRFVQESGLRVGPVLCRSIAAALPFGLSLLAVWGGYRLLTGHSMLDVIRAGSGVHLGLSLELPHLANAGLSAWDFVLFAGLPISGLAVASAFSRRLPGVTCLAIGLGGTLLALLLGDVARFEIARSWSFFMPFVTLLGSTVFVQLGPVLRRALLAGQVILLVTFAATFTPQHTQARWTPTYAEVAAPPLRAPETPVNARFGEDLHLSAYQAEYRPETQTLALALKWEALRQTDLPYYFSAVLVAPDGRALPGVAWQPLERRYPTTCWRPGEPVLDQIELPLGSDAAGGDWWLSLRAFGLLDEQPLPPLTVSLPDGAQDDQIGLGPFRLNLEQ